MEKLDFYINGALVKPSASKTLDVINPATEKVIARTPLGNKQDVDKVVSAAKKAFKASVSSLLFLLTSDAINLLFS